MPPDFVMSALRALTQRHSHNVKRKRVSFYPGLEPGGTPLFEQEAPNALGVEKRKKKKDKREKTSWVEKLRPLAAQGLDAIKDLAIQTTCSGSEAPLVATWTGLFPIRSIRCEYHKISIFRFASIFISKPSKLTEPIISESIKEHSPSVLK